MHDKLFHFTIKCSIINLANVFTECVQNGVNMDKNNEVKEFFESPFAEDYLSCTDHLVRRSVTGISASCEILRGMAEKNGDKTSCEIVDGIMTMCCELMRNAELSKALTAIDGDAERDMRTMRVDMFLEDFAKNCRSVLGGKCVIEYEKPQEIYVRTNKEILRFLLLSFIRRSILGSGDAEAEFEAGCEETGKSVEIYIRAKRTFVDETAFGQPDVFESYPVEVTNGLAARIGAEAKISADGISVVIPLPDGNSPAIVEAPSVDYGERFFNAFNIMLRDLPH